METGAVNPLRPDPKSAIAYLDARSNLMASRKQAS